LMMALSSSVDAPACHFLGGCCDYDCYDCCDYSWGGGYGYYGGYGCYYGYYGSGYYDYVPVMAQASEAPATLVVSLPAEAKLSIDDQATVSTSAVRTFATPALAAGMEYYYTLKAEVIRDGKTVTSTQRVVVHAGQTSRVTLDIPTAAGVVSAK